MHLRDARFERYELRMCATLRWLRGYKQVKRLRYNQRVEKGGYLEDPKENLCEMPVSQKSEPDSNNAQP